jgi:hypothetical protein
MFRVGTAQGLYTVDSDVTLVARGGESIDALAGGWAVVDGHRVVDLDGASELQIEPRVWCVAPSGDGAVVGTEAARLFTVSADGVAAPVVSFDEIPTRDEWYTPWGAPPDTRSLTVVDGTLLANVHVGGVWRDNADSGWDEVVDVDSDTHQVVAGPPGSGVVAIAAAVGFGLSTDGGRTFSWTAAGLHGSYCRAVAVAGDWAVLTASTGPFTERGAVYRRRLDDTEGAFERCSVGLPVWFPSNIDTHHVAADGNDVVFGTDDGRLFRSTDGGATWDLLSDGLPPVQCVAVAA